MQFSVALPAQQHSEASSPLDRDQFRRQLARLESNCDRLDLQAEAEISREWLSNERKDQQRYYLPTEFPQAAGSVESTSWRKHFVASRKRFAAHLFNQARHLVDEGDEAGAYKLLWQVLREDPEHKEALKIIGPLRAASSARHRKRGGGSDLAGVGPAKLWQTRHFDILSRASAEDTQKMAGEVEQFYAIWTQVFYELWAPPGRLKSRMNGAAAQWPEPKESMQIVLLADRDEYLKAIGAAEANIAVSVGYYSPRSKCCYFYWTDEARETVFHELTHQLFAEASLVSPMRASQATEMDRLPGAWCIEGIATYMESLRPASEGWTLGGIDSPRLQTARYRALRDEYWPPWDAFCKATIAEWKTNSDIALSYSHAAGLTHAFLDLHPDRSAARQAYFRYLTGVYSGQSSPNELQQLLGENEEVAQTKYRELLNVTDQQLQDVIAGNPDCKELVLSRSHLENWDTVGKFKELQWLDVSFTNIKPGQIAWLKELTELRRLSVEATLFDGSSLPIIAGLPNLVELDLSQCDVDDADLIALKNHPTLEILWLSQTKVTQKAAEMLRTIPKLKQCDVLSVSAPSEIP